MTPWLNLLLATTRLLDLHDSAHMPGSAAVQVDREQRPGRRDGFWLEMACLMLDYLLEEDYRTNSAFVPQSRCLNYLRQFEPSLKADDVLYIVNMLATPSELFFRRRQMEDGSALQASTKQTALLEKQRQTGLVRLSHSGRQAAQLSLQVEDLLYSEHDAAKVLTAIRRDDYARVPDLCNRLLLTIRGMTQALRQMRENPTREGKLEAFRAQQKHYHHALNGLQKTLLDCRHQMSAPQWRERFIDWADQQVPPWDLMQLSVSLNRVLNAIENLSRRLSELLADIAEDRVQSMGVTDFMALAQQLLLTPPRESQQEALIAQIMPWQLSVCIPDIEPLARLIRVERSERSTRTLVFDEGDALPHDATALQRFVSTHGAAMRERLKQGPLSLSEALASGWAQLEEEDGLPQLINMFVDPGQLEPTLEVALESPAAQFEYVMPDGRRLTGDDPRLRYRISDE